MLGSYATAELDKNARLGVIAIQDESAALASVTDMRRQTFWISLIAALLTLAIGFYFAQKLTQPVRELYEKKIASGLIPLARWGTPDDVGRAVGAIAAGAFPYSTGSVFEVDGGLSLRIL